MKQYVYGLHSVAALLENKAHDINSILVQDNRHDGKIQKLITLAQKNNIPCQSHTKQELDKLINANHQGIIAIVTATAKAYDLANILENLSEPALLLILDGVQDPHNLGACLRSANAAGVHAVIAPKDKAVGITDVVRKVASGAVETTPFIQVTNLARTIKQLQEQGIWIYGADAEACDNIYDIDLRGPVALVLGAEGRGLRRLTKESCDGLLKIPMSGDIASLNVSVAAGICLFEAVRQRQ